MGATGGTSGASALACDPADPPRCFDSALAVCGADGTLVLTQCEADFACLADLAGAPRCTPIELTLGTTKNQFDFAWRDAFMLLPCYAAQDWDCITIPSGATCPNLDAPNVEDRGLILKEAFEVGGDVGKLYTAHIQVNGIVSGKYYQLGKRDRGEDFDGAQDPAGTDAFYRGGEPVASTYAVYKLTVRDAGGADYAHYYLNSFPQASGLESHQTVPIGYEKDIAVPGGGTIEYLSQSPNCRAMNNCGPGNGCDPRNVPNEPGLELPATWGGQPLASWNLVNGGKQPFHAQLVHVRVTKVVRKLPEPPEPPFVGPTCTFADPYVQDAIGARLGNPISKEQAEQMRTLSLRGLPVQSLEGMECLLSLVDLDMSDTSVFDLSPLAGLTALTSLNADNTGVTDIAPLAGLTKLETLSLANNAVVNLSPLSALTSLAYLYLKDNQVADLTPISDLPVLKHLDLALNPLNCMGQASNLNQLCATVLAEEEHFWNTDCGPQPSSLLSVCPVY